MFKKDTNKESKKEKLKKTVNQNLLDSNKKSKLSKDFVLNDKNKFNFKKILTIVMVIVIIGLGYLFYYEKGQAMFLSWQMNPGLTNKSDNYYTETSLNIDLDDINLEKKDFNSSFIPVNGNIKKASFKIKGESNVMAENLESIVNLDLDIGQNLNLSSKIKKIGDKFYIKPQISDLNNFIPFISVADLGEDWILLNSEDQDFSNMAFFSVLKSKGIKDKLDVDLESKLIEFLRGVKKQDFFSIHDPHKTKIVQGKKLKKIEYTIKENKTEDLILFIASVFSKNKETAQENKENFIQNCNEDPEQCKNLKKIIKNLNFSAWVNPKTKFIKGFEVQLKNFLLETSSFSSKLEAGFSILTQDIKEKEILAPKSYLTLSEMIQSQKNQFSQQVKNNNEEEARNKENIYADEIYFKNVKPELKKEFSVPIAMDNLKDLQAFNLAIEFDPDVIEPIGATLKGGILEDTGMMEVNVDPSESVLELIEIENPQEAGVILLGYATAYPINNNGGEVVYLQFRSIGENKALTRLRFRQLILNETSHLNKANNAIIEIK